MASLNPGNIRDFGLVAYLETKGHSCLLNSDKNSYSVSLSLDDFARIIKPYFKEVKPLLDEVRKIKKEISTHKS